jgi:pilus assembly protein CpaC
VRSTAATTPVEDNSARVARIEATAARLAQARTAAAASPSTSGSN